MTKNRLPTLRRKEVIIFFHAGNCAAQRTTLALNINQFISNRTVYPLFGKEERGENCRIFTIAYDLLNNRARCCLHRGLARIRFFKVAHNRGLQVWCQQPCNAITQKNRQRTTIELLHRNRTGKSPSCFDQLIKPLSKFNVVTF